MKKCTFIKTCRNGNHTKSIKDIKDESIDKNDVVMITSKYIFIKQDGYYETLTDNNGNKFEICFYKRNSTWVATEKTTGLIVWSSTTRKGCCNELCDYCLNKIQVGLNSKVSNKIKLEVQKAYELLENKN